jgi:hypothetical protein
MMGLMLRCLERCAAGIRQNCPEFGRADRSPGAAPGVLTARELSDTGMPGSPTLRVGMRVALHLLWAIVAGVVTIVLGSGLVSLVVGIVPVPRRYLAAGGITTLALAVACLGPAVVERLATSHRLMRASHHVARYGQAWITGRFGRRARKHQPNQH